MAAVVGEGRWSLEGSRRWRNAGSASAFHGAQKAPRRRQSPNPNVLSGTRTHAFGCDYNSHPILELWIRLKGTVPKLAILQGGFLLKQYDGMNVDIQLHMQNNF
jgi:hypothetical protein